MSKKIVKLAVIRTNEDEPCPFGLKIPYACKKAGEIVSKMAPIDILGDKVEKDEIKALVRANRKLMILEADGNRCPYADKVFSDKKAVECNFDSNAPGISQVGLEPSKFYSKVYDNIAYDGLYSYPMGWYGDNNISRNLYYGAYSLQGSEEKKEIEKTAQNKEQDIKDAVEHSLGMVDGFWSGTICYNIEPERKMTLEEILDWDDYSSWGEFDNGELLKEEDLEGRLDDFRPGWGRNAMEWLRTGNIPPIVLVRFEDEDGRKNVCIGDGRGRVSLAVGLNLRQLPVIVMRESKNGQFCFEIEQGRIK